MQLIASFEELGMAFIETSAKDAINVQDAFQTMSAELIAKRDQQGARATVQSNNVDLWKAQNRGNGNLQGACGGDHGSSVAPVRNALFVMMSKQHQGTGTNANDKK